MNRGASCERTRLFKEPTPAWKTHPLFRYWQGVKADPSVADVRMELYRPKEGLVYRPADIYLHVKRVDERQDPPQKIDWEDVVNEGLLHLQVKAVDADWVALADLRPGESFGDVHPPPDPRPSSWGKFVAVLDRSWLPSRVRSPLPAGAATARWPSRRVPSAIRRSP
ncbi:MAG: hypothetical protein E6J90_19760 [Deltaproteobacteria bacterium]|nr:MAG: hypothetical protein E6J91_20680 [Deltaproteobacteria bacterium]TMQ18624.1 MAG: hypothetical protein E6J90_19760 [Deltaproteobacteria bacterium]